MSFVKIWVHVVWATNNRAPILVSEKRQELFEHIRQNGSAKNLYIESVNGHDNHVHCLLRLRNDQTIMKTVQLLKDESSYWANKMKLFPEKIVWEKEYYAVSVSESEIPKVKAYISNQEMHHKNTTWPQEYTELIAKYNFSVMNV